MLLKRNENVSVLLKRNENVSVSIVYVFVAEINPSSMDIALSQYGPLATYDIISTQ